MAKQRTYHEQPHIQRKPSETASSQGSNRDSQAGDVRSLVKRAQQNPGGLSSGEVIHLQRTIGNHAVQRLLNPKHQGSADQVQRLFADGYNALYVPLTWMSARFDDMTETVQQALDDRDKEAMGRELKENFADNTGLSFDEAKSVNPPEQAKNKLAADGYTFQYFDPEAQTAGFGQKKTRRLQKKLGQTKLPQILATMLANHNRVYQLPADNKINIDVEKMATTLALNPEVLVKSPDDLGESYEINKICSLIALLKGETANLSKLNAALKLKSTLKNLKDYYALLHRYFYQEKHIQYDEPSTHPAIYRDWGYSLIASGNTTFGSLSTILRQKLGAGKGYIFDITGHTVYITMRRDFLPGQLLGETERISDYFEFQSDPSNFPEANEGTRRVSAIYAK